ncbi:hypothetical protein Goarm_018414 [Gossypium armourianum]|uniref:Transposase-associated domain-containing protein n=1 Tax=Gossypium armourianum TaxID=34283 RepID=A0A7J9II93_9ROSI|nr:hypothetical protein [Gossypium armourianum]
MVYMNGIASFIEYATENCTNSYNIYCPCKKCSNKVLCLEAAIGLNVPIHDRDKFSHGDHVNGGGGIDSTLLPSEDVRRTTDEVISLIDDL